MNTEVYSWRLPASLKRRLERAAVERDRSLADLLREIAEEWLATAPASDDSAVIEAARRRALEVSGSVAGGDPDRAERTRERIRRRLARGGGGGGGRSEG